LIKGVRCHFLGHIGLPGLAAEPMPANVMGGQIECEASGR
jgi:hypothetical protein